MKQGCKAKILQQYKTTDAKSIATLLDPHFKHYKDDEEKNKEVEVVKIEMLKASNYDDTNNVVDIQQVLKQIFQHLNLASFWGKGMVQGRFNQMVVQMVPLEVECHH